MAIIYDTYCVYIHTTPSDKAYIGITCQKPEHRWGNGERYKQHRYFYAAIKKYGWNNIQHTIFASMLTKEQACRLEQQLIALFDTTNREHGYNQSIGGDIGNRGSHLSEEARKAIAERSRGRRKSPEEIEKIRNGHLGKRLSNETKQKLREINLGKTLSDDTKKKIGNALRGRNYANAKAVYCVELQMTFSSSVKAAEYLNHPDCGGNILRACKKPTAIAYGYHWRYIDTNQEVG